MNLRPYQSDAFNCAVSELRAGGATLLVLPTGAGKTVVFSHIVKEFLPQGRALIIAHREELLTQAKEKIRAITGQSADIEMGDQRAAEGFLKAPVVISSIQTQTAGRTDNRRYGRFDPREFSILVIDEAHHAPAKTYRELIRYYKTANPNIRILGVTATPDRADEQALGQIFTSCAFDYEIVQAIDEGWLVPIAQQYLSVEVNFDGVPVVLGDFQGRALRDLLSTGTIIEQIASDTVQYAGTRKTLAFSDSVDNAVRLCNALNRLVSDSARIVTGDTPRDERRQLFTDYRNGGFQYLVNVGVATEGFDEPGVGCVAIAHPTMSRALYAQMIGRGTRPLTGLVDGLDTDDARRIAISISGKPDLLVLDVVGNSLKHKLISVADVLGGNYSPEIIAGAERLMRAAKGPVNVADALRRAEEINNKRILAEAKKQAKLTAKQKSRARDVDPFGVLGIVAQQTRGWDEGKEPTQGQLGLLLKWGMNLPENTTRAQASQLIDEGMARMRQGLASFKQINLLARSWGMSVDDARGLSKTEASRRIDLLRQNNWRKPVGVL